MEIPLHRNRDTKRLERVDALLRAAAAFDRSASRPPCAIPIERMKGSSPYDDAEPEELRTA